MRKDASCLSPTDATQMYNEEVNDLLAPENKKLQVHESREQGVYVAGLREDIVTSATQARMQCTMGSPVGSQARVRTSSIARTACTNCRLICVSPIQTRALFLMIAVGSLVLPPY